jgi:polyisoprenoid-binding protein YceI
VTLAPGATSGNTATITVTPAGGFTGTVTLTAAVTASPAGAQYAPTLSFGSTGTLNITGSGAQQATLTISSIAPMAGAFNHPIPGALRRYGAGAAALACVLFLCFPTRRRSWKQWLGLVGLAVAATGVQACTNGPGTGTPPTRTTPTVTVTPSPASITSATPLTVTIAVAGGTGKSTPTGTVSLVSGTYSSATATLSNGGANINIPANSLGVGTDPLNANYSPDASSAPTYNYASGTNTVIVTAANVPGTTPGTYTITITGTSGSVTAAGSINLIVQ